MRYLVVILICNFLFCKKSKDRTVNILALGHIYQWDDTNRRVDPRIAALPLDTFDQLWLLGDLLGRTDESPANYHYLDSLFDLTAEHTYWVEGNHDVNTGRVAVHPLKPEPYSRHHDAGLEIWRLNTNLFTWPEGTIPDTACRAANRQYEHVRRWAATLPAGTGQLVVLHHQALLTNAQYSGKSLNKVWNYYHDRLNARCAPAGTFTDWYLPIFEQIREQGIPVTFVGGDIGQRVKTFDYRAPNGLRYLGTGINNSMDPRYPPPYVTSLAPDSILTLQYTPATQGLTYRFLPLGGESAAYHAIWARLE